MISKIISTIVRISLIAVIFVMNYASGRQEMATHAIANGHTYRILRKL
jgi:hypothetical protein